MKKLSLLILLPFLLFAGDRIFQISTIDALLAGLYDGLVSLEELRQKGDFGLGTFHGLDGEMVLLEGIFYQVKADGKVYRPTGAMKSPFAAVIQFEAEEKLELEKGVDFQSFEQIVDDFLPTFNIVYAFRLEGKFNYIKTRSVPQQQKPYPALADIAATQPTFEYENIEGTIIGYRCPSFVKGINVPGYHLHFLSKDKKVGGHLLKFRVNSALLEIDKIHGFEMELPRSSEFYRLNLAADKTEELKKVEK
ncbi:MAG: acetolactate decarboxylase [Candidatus Marinimicrobia bacterium]|nr:acetolactate decarboxylase [Candidatus Neomarinimicrobiota bacterium]